MPVGKFLKGAESVRSLVEPLLWNDGYCDARAVLPLYPIYDESNPAPAEMFETKERTDTVKESKKGPLILILLILAVLLLLALIGGIIALTVTGIVHLVN